MVHEVEETAHIVFVHIPQDDDGVLTGIALEKTEGEHIIINFKTKIASTSSFFLLLYYFTVILIVVCVVTTRIWSNKKYFALLEKLNQGGSAVHPRFLALM